MWFYQGDSKIRLLGCFGGDVIRVGLAGFGVKFEVGRGDATPGARGRGGGGRVPGALPSHVASLPAPETAASLSEAIALFRRKAREWGGGGGVDVHGVGISTRCLRSMEGVSYTPKPLRTGLRLKQASVNPNRFGDHAVQVCWEKLLER